MASAVLYRMVTPEHVCPFGLKTRGLLQRQGFEVEDHLLGDRRQTDAFKSSHGVDTTPQVFIDGQRIGGYDALRRHFGLDAAAEGGGRYTPVVVVFAVCLVAAAALQWNVHHGFEPLQLPAWFVALSMCVLAVLKLRDLEAFSNQFLGYDLLAQRVVRYAYVYPFAEAFAGVGMLADTAGPLVAGVALVIGSVGAVSVVKAVYIDKRELKCAWVGGNSQVPLGFVSLTENLMMVLMVLMALWMLLRGI